MEVNTYNGNVSNESYGHPGHNQQPSTAASVGGVGENPIVVEKPRGRNIPEPYTGMEFKTIVVARRFYFEYAERMGFKVRITNRRRAPLTDHTIGLTIVCSRQGYRKDKDKPTDKTGCQAMYRVNKVKKAAVFVVTKFVKEHNHELENPRDRRSVGPGNHFPLKGVKTFIQGLRKGFIIKEVDANAAGIDDRVENAVGRASTVSNENTHLEPCPGMEFESEEDATVYYFKYATHVGFNIRISSRHRSKRGGGTTGLKFVCTKEGFHRKECTSAREQTREGCMAMLSIKKRDSGKWIVTKVVKDHSHPLFPRQVPILRPYKVVRNQLAVSGEVDSAVQDRANYIRNLREKTLGRDAQEVLEYFKRMQSKNASFFYAIQVDKEYRMTNFFWADARARIAYSYFGDVVTFDVTYNQYGVPFALFLGCNRHKQPILFGSALLLDEKEASFVWLFSTFLDAMCGCHPFSVISNQDPAIDAAIKKVFPDAHHHYIKQDILKKAPDKLEDVEGHQEEMMRDFSKCINMTELNDEFESCWQTFIDKYELTENKWLQFLYKNRERWIQVYPHDTSSVSIFAPLSENTMTFSFGRINAYASLQAFVDQCEKAVDNQCEREFEEDFKTIYMKPVMRTGLAMENQVTGIYTRAIFLDFQEQLFQSLHHTAEIAAEDGPMCTAKVSEFGVEKSAYTVTFNSSEVTATCSCQMFEYAGILCRHILRVLSMKNIDMLPSHCILKRWSRNSLSVEFDEPNNEELGCGHEPWTLRYNYLFFQTLKYAWKSSETLNVYYVAWRSLRKAFEEVDGANKFEVIDIQHIHRTELEPENATPVGDDDHEKNPTDDAVSDEEEPTTVKKPAEVRKKRKRTCQVCKQPNHDKRKCPQWIESRRERVRVKNRRTHEHLASIASKLRANNLPGVDSANMFRKVPYWLAPREGTFKLNFAGAMDPDGKAGGIGAIIRNHEGRAVRAYAETVPGNSPIYPELMALYEGVKLCVQLQLPVVSIEGDTSRLAELITQTGTPSWDIKGYWKNVQDELKNIGSWKIIYCVKTANRVAHELALTKPPEAVVYTDNLPEHVGAIAIEEAGGAKQGTESARPVANEEAGGAKQGTESTRPVANEEAGGAKEGAESMRPMANEEAVRAKQGTDELVSGFSI